MYYYRVNNTVCCSWTALDLPEAAAAEQRQVTVFLFERPLTASRAHFQVTHEAQLYQGQEDAGWLSTTVLAQQAAPQRAQWGALDAAVQAALAAGRLRAVNRLHPRWQELLAAETPLSGGKKRVHILALGDVGSHILIGLHLLGGDCIERIGICDLNENVAARWEFEANQIALPWDYDALPAVEIVPQERLFDCDVFVFVASAGVPAVGSSVDDVRMVQLEKNTAIISAYARQARAAQFRGLFCEVADPVDPLAKAAWLASNRNDAGEFDGLGLLPEQIQGYGLGVMNARAAYYAKQDDRFARFLSEGRCFGGHGKELVIADSIDHYDDACSRALTELALNANVRMREIGFKPFVAPAYSSGALSILATLRGEWHYGSVFLGGSYMGVKNRYTPVGQAHEMLPLPEALMARIYDSQASLRAIN